VRWFALVTAAVCACYSPKPPAGAACGVGGACPDGLVCSAATQTCELHDLDAGVGNDALAIDAPPDAFVPFCYGTAIVRVCMAQQPGGGLTFSAATTINTDTDTRCAALLPIGETDVCAIAADHIKVDATVKATGSRPLVLVATTTITVSGNLDGASDNASPGPNSDPAICAAGTNALGNGGGYGGSFGGIGGTGGGVGGGTPAPSVTTIDKLRGGCASGIGGGNVHAVKGGGAVYLIAVGSITVTGTINASGDSGEAGSGTAQGGSGGASGGMIGFDAPLVTVTSTGQVFANGGGAGVIKIFASTMTLSGALSPPPS